MVKQLPVELQTELFRFLLLQQWGKWEQLSRYGADQARLITQKRGLDWDRMNEEERENLIDDLVYED